MFVFVCYIIGMRAFCILLVDGVVELLFGYSRSGMSSTIADGKVHANPLDVIKIYRSIAQWKFAKNMLWFVWFILLYSSYIYICHKLLLVEIAYSLLLLLDP